MKKIYFLLLYTVVLLSTAYPQVALEWQVSMGGPGIDFGYNAKQTYDGGYVIAGHSDSVGGDISVNYGGYDYWLVRLDSPGVIRWQKSYGGSATDRAYDVVQASDSGFVIAGGTTSDDTDVTGNHGSFDFWIVKTDTGGTLLWQRAIGGSGWDVARSIQRTNDGGYVAAGYSESNDGDATVNKGLFDFWIVKLDVNGTIQWQKSYGGSDDDEAYAVQQTWDGGYILAGSTLSNDSDVTGNHGDYDFWIVKLDSMGNLQWQRSAGGTQEDIAFAVTQVHDSGYVVAGHSFSNDGDVSGNNGAYDYWVIKLDTGGTLLWQQCLGGSNSDFASSVLLRPDSGFIVAGASNSTDGDVTANIGDYDFWIVKLDFLGNLAWEKSFGGTLEDSPNSLSSTFDGGFVIGGLSFSNDVDVTGNQGIFDYWVVKTAPPVIIGIQESKAGRFSVYPNPATTEIYVDLNQAPGNGCRVEVINSLGQVVQTTENVRVVDQIILPIGNLPAGIYSVRVSLDNSHSSTRILKVR